jgi:integrase
VKRYLIEADLIEKFDEDRLEDIDKFALQTHLNKLAKIHSRDRVLQIRAYMQAIFSEAVDQDFLPKDPARKVKVPTRLRETDKTVLTWDQLRSALACLELRDRIILELDMTNALRPSELFGLRWKCFDRSARAMSLVETTYMGEIRDWGKTKGSLRTIPLSRDLTKELCAWELECPDTSPDAFIFPNANGGFIDTGNYRKRVLHKLARDLGLPKLTFQVIRRTIATLAQRKGTVKDVQGVLRHSRIATTTDVYMPEIPEGVRATIDSIHRELRKSSKPGNARSGKKSASPRLIGEKTGTGTGRAGVLEGQKLQERRSASDFKTHSQKGFENLLPNATKVLRTGVTPVVASA